MQGLVLEASILEDTFLSCCGALLRGKEGKLTQSNIVRGRAGSKILTLPGDLGRTSLSVTHAEQEEMPSAPQGHCEGEHQQASSLSA